MSIKQISKAADDLLFEIQAADSLEEYERIIQEYDVALKECLVNISESQKLGEVIDPAIWILSALYLISQIVIMAIVSYAGSKLDKKQTKIVQDILDTKRWKVRLLDMGAVWNAYSIGANSVFLSKSFATSKKVTEREITAVSLHEISHSKTFDVFIGMATRIGGGTAVFVTIFAAATAVLPIAVVVIIISWILFGLMDGYVSQKMEYKSDAFAGKHGYGDEIISALKKLIEHNEKLAEKQGAKIKKCDVGDKWCKRFQALSELFSSHPNLKKRAENIAKKKEFWEAAKKGPKAVKAFVAKQDQLVAA